MYFDNSCTSVYISLIPEVLRMDRKAVSVLLPQGNFTNQVALSKDASVSHLIHTLSVLRLTSTYLLARIVRCHINPHCSIFHSRLGQRILCSPPFRRLTPSFFYSMVTAGFFSQVDVGQNVNLNTFVSLTPSLRRCGIVPPLTHAS